MDKFKVGDKVRIINCVEPYSEEFNDYIGKTAIITKVNNFSTYDIDIDKGENNWYNSELELADKPKEYTIHNLINDFPFETEFVNSVRRTKYRIQDGDLYYYNSMSKAWRLRVSSFKEISDMKFTKVEESKLKPMTFEEAIASGNKIRYEYKDEEIIQENFLLLDEIMESLSLLVCWRIARVILKGTWYAEGVYE